MTDRSRVLFISLTDDTGCERLPIEFIARGVACACLSPRGFLCAKVGGIRRFRVPAHRGLWLGALGLAKALQRAFDAFAPDLLVPLDDLSAWLLRGLGASRRVSPALRSAIERSTGAPRGRDAARWRVVLMDEARAAGVPVPPYRAFPDARGLMAVAATLQYPLVVKEENSCGGRGVFIAHSVAELRQVLGPAAGQATPRALIKRLRGRARRFAWHRAGMPADRWHALLLQQLVPGQPALCTVVADRGRVLESFCLVTERNHPPPTGASTVVRFIAHDGMRDHAARLVERLGYSGFVSFDFILSPDERRATLIEMNARPVGTVHLGRRFGRDVCGASLRLLGGAAPAPPPPEVPDTRMVALFPKELERDPDSFAAGVPAGLVHDVPWGEPAVTRGYGRRLARLHPSRAGEIWRQIAARAQGPEASATGRAGPAAPSRRDRLRPAAASDRPPVP